MTLDPQNLYTHILGARQYTTDVANSSRLKSVTQERDLDEFLSTATLAGLEFTAG
jgi:large subunit GTPase 1